MYTLRGKESDVKKPFNAEFDIWHYMAYAVAHELNLRPLDILLHWGCEELLVTFGTYMNDKMAEKYAEYQAMDSKTKATVKADEKPREYAIRFVTFEQLEQMNQPKSESEKRAEEEERLKIEAFMKGM